MPQTIDSELKAKLVSDIFRPAITTWNRLEGRPRREDFDRSLRVEVRDSLWMICRQWQFGEFKGEDTGSAVGAKVLLSTARLNRYSVKNDQAVGYNDRLPLETMVEREPIHFDLMTRAQMGRHWFKLIENIQGLEDIDGVKGHYLAEYPLTEPGSESLDENEAKFLQAQIRSDRKAWQILKALEGRVVDGEKLLQAIRSASSDHANWLASTDISADDQSKLLIEAPAFEAWFRRVYSQPDALDNASWADSYLEYQFKCSAPADEEGEQQTVLVAEQYHQGDLDWYSFRIDNTPNARLVDRPGAPIPAGGIIEEEPRAFIPNPIEFGGMPNVRWWEFEDSKTDFGNINPSTSELATLLLAEFGLIYGNDWSLVPYVLPVGTLSELKGIVVKDVFGLHTLVRPASDNAGGERLRWGMYYLDSVQGGQIDTRLFLPPAISKLQESSPLERVILTRDEMANMVWGIEEIIPSLAYGGVKGQEAALDFENFLLAQAAPPSETDEIETDAVIRYKLGTTVPEHWIPFIPVHKTGSNREIRLQRAAMPRLIPGMPRIPVEPRGAVLRPGLDNDPKQPYFVHEEEVPRAGVVVSRTYQRVRWLDGRVYTWLGRRKQTGRGQGSSGLEFDRIVPIE
jgi:hypothetical protein